MNPNGPEYRPGWRTVVDVDGLEVVVAAAHTTRRRMPRGHELVRQAARGRHEMVEDPVHEWSVVADRRRIGTVRPLPNGRFQATGRREAFATLEDAASALAAPIAASRPASPAPGR